MRRTWLISHGPARQLAIDLLCAEGMLSAVVNLHNPMEIIVTPEATCILMSHNNVYRRIYTDGCGWFADAERTLVGYSIGRWIDENGDGRYTPLQFETRYLRGPRAYIPFHADN